MQPNGGKRPYSQHLDLSAAQLKTDDTTLRHSHAVNCLDLLSDRFLHGSPNDPIHRIAEMRQQAKVTSDTDYRTDFFMRFKHPYLG